MESKLLSLPHHLLSEILHKAGFSGAAAACCCTSLLHAWAVVLSDPAHTTALLLQRYGSVDAALKHLYAYGFKERKVFFYDHHCGRRTAFGALDGFLKTLSYLPKGPAIPIKEQESSFVESLTAAANELCAERPEALSASHRPQPEPPQQQTPFWSRSEAAAGTEAEDVYAEAVVRGLVAQDEGFDADDTAGEAVGRGAAIAGHERVVVFLLSRGACPIQIMNAANWTGSNVRLCTALLAAMRPYVRITFARDGGLLRAGQGAAAAQQQAAAAVAGGAGGEGQLSSEWEQKAEGLCKRMARICLKAACQFAPAQRSRTQMLAGRAGRGRALPAAATAVEATVPIAAPGVRATKVVAASLRAGG